jgi:hypothetical protein
MKKDLIDVFMNFYQANKKVKNVLEIDGDSVFDPIIEDIQDMIMAEYNIPEDNSSEYKENEEGFFSRDFFYDAVYEFGNGEINKKQLQKILKNWNKED